MASAMSVSRSIALIGYYSSRKSWEVEVLGPAPYLAVLKRLLRVKAGAAQPGFVRGQEHTWLGAKKSFAFLLTMTYLAPIVVL